MSEVQSRPAASRGRGSGRGGRGGGNTTTRGAGRAPTRSSPTNGDSKHEPESALPSLEDEGEVGQLKKQYGAKVELIKEMFPQWSDVDILFALRETDGDENLTVTRMAEGSIPQWGEVSNTKKERARPKAKTDTFSTTTGDSGPAGHSRPARGGRPEGGRGRGRATERGGRGGVRGKPAVATTNGTRPKEASQLSVPTDEASDWETPKVAEITAAAWGEEAPASAPAPAAAAAPPSYTPVATPAVAPKPSAVPESAPKTWASIAKKPIALPKPAPKPKEIPVPTTTEPVIEPLPAAELPVHEPEPAVVEQEEEEQEEEEEPTPEPAQETPAPAPVDTPHVVVPEVALPPSKDQLTETNLEQIVDDSHPPETETAASEAADSWDPRVPAPSATATPNSASQQQHQNARAPSSGFAATATKATDRATNRTPNFPRRILDQREAVRMPGNRDQVDRAAVQFGAFSLNGPIDEDIDGDREEPETRPQPPEDSPVIHPRTSLPPAQPAPVPEAFPAQKPVASLPPTGPSAAAAPAAPSQPSAPTPVAQPPAAAVTTPFGRYNGSAPPQEPASFPTSKPFESFPQQQPSVTAAQSQYEASFQSQVQATQAQAQQPGAAYSSAPGEFSSHYSDPQSRYNNYYNNQNYSQQQQQGAQGQQEGLPSQPQRSFSGYNAQQNDNLSQYPQSGAQHASRFASGSVDVQTSGTPTPSQPGSQVPVGQNSQTHAGQQPQDYAQQYNQHPYYTNPYYSAYMNYQGGGYNQGGYGAPYGKAGVNYQPNQYGMSPQGPHGYGTSPAGTFGQSTLHRESGVSAGLGDYGRATSVQAGQQPALGGSGFGGVHETYGRGASAYQSQAGHYVPGAQPGSVPAVADELKPFGDAKVAGGPSPSLGAAARPGSAANNVPSQTGLPPSQSNQQSGLGGMGYGYPSHVQGHGLHGNQSGAAGYGMSASGAQGQGHQNSYGAYGGQNFGAGNYYGAGGQPPNRPWGNNY
ncbi:hypothetical protein B0T22DRAFT_439847 [Podospora appendiculata]|uniref:RNA polymerase II degradation factor 1 n=1 Tax=Podospora appendiculata TaxID=314037 RepID=A0AAE0X900_9PEZI|nr:hypothetical protein B0T22DRAFT_439847 [Podospora appendiculata]